MSHSHSHHGQDPYLFLPIFNAERRRVPCASALGVAPESQHYTVFSLGRYRVLVYPRAVRRLLGWRTMLIPARQCWRTVALVAGSYIVMELLAHYFAGRPATVGRLLGDGALALACIIACLATAMTDPGIMPPATEVVEMEATGKTSTTTEVVGNSTSTVHVIEMVEKSRMPSPLRRHGAISQEEKEALMESRKDRSSHEMHHNEYLAAQDPAYSQCDNYDLTCCKWCQHLRPKGTSHDPKVGTCVQRYDHHCGFAIYGAIGLRNLRQFVVFITLCLLCVGHGTLVINRPIFNMIAFRDEKLLESAEVRSVAVLGLCGAVLILWCGMMAFMVANYLVMLFVPGAASTRDVWRKLCKGKSASSSSSSNSTGGFNFGAKQDDDTKIRFFEVFFGIPDSLLPAWCNDVSELEFGEGLESDADDDDDAEEDEKKQQHAGAAPPPSAAVAAMDEAGELELDEVASDREELIAK